MIVRGDDYFAKILPNVDFIKIDIEGFEAPAIVGMQKILKRDMPIILMEVTLSSADLFQKYGGFETCIPFAFRIFEVSNPLYDLGLIQRNQYQLAEISDLHPRRASYNVLIVPNSRMPQLSHGKAARSMKVAT